MKTRRKLIFNGTYSLSNLIDGIGDGSLTTRFSKDYYTDDGETKLINSLEGLGINGFGLGLQGNGKFDFLAGYKQTLIGNYSSILGGSENSLYGNHNIITGGTKNKIGSEDGSTTYCDLGGADNEALSYLSFIRGQYNRIGRNCYENSILGISNTIKTSTRGSFISGKENTIDAYGIGLSLLGKGLKIGPDSSFVADGVSGVGRYNLYKRHVLYYVGNGTSDTSRSNALEIYTDGRGKLYGTPSGDYDILRWQEKIALENLISEEKTRAESQELILFTRIDSLDSKTNSQNSEIISIKETLDAFLSEASIGDAAVDTLKEIQNYITTDGQAADGMIKKIGTNEENILFNAGEIDKETTRATEAEADLQNRLNQIIPAFNYYDDLNYRPEGLGFGQVKITLIYGPDNKPEIIKEIDLEANPKLLSNYQFPFSLVFEKGVPQEEKTKTFTWEILSSGSNKLYVDFEITYTMYDDYSIYVISSSSIAYVDSRDSEFSFGDLAIGLQNVVIEFIEPSSFEFIENPQKTGLIYKVN